MEPGNSFIATSGTPWVAFVLFVVSFPCVAVALRTDFLWSVFTDSVELTFSLISAVLWSTVLFAETFLLSVTFATTGDASLGFTTTTSFSAAESTSKGSFKLFVIESISDHGSRTLILVRNKSSGMSFNAEDTSLAFVFDGVSFVSVFTGKDSSSSLTPSISLGVNDEVPETGLSFSMMMVIFFGCFALLGVEETECVMEEDFDFLFFSLKNELMSSSLSFDDAAAVVEAVDISVMLRGEKLFEF